MEVYRSNELVPRTPPPKKSGKSKKKGGGGGGGVKGVIIEMFDQGDEGTHGLLENFDLELESKERQFRLHLQTVLAAFKLRQVSEIARIPPKLLKMTIEDVEKHWGGNWAGTLGRIAVERQREEEVGEDEKERVLREGVKGKRKRAGTVHSSPERANKNLRKAPTPLKGRPITIPPSASKRKLGGKKTVPYVSTNPSKGPSSLPQNHIFNPILPPTPVRKMNPTDVLLSMNGSPVVNPLSKSTRERQNGNSGQSTHTRITSSSQAQDEVSDEESDSEDDDLPDAEAYAAKLLARSLSQSQSQSSRSAPVQSKSIRTKRQPSLLWRESFQGGPIHEEEENGGDKEEEEGEDEKVNVKLPNGTYISFNPLALNRAVMNQEMIDRGLNKKERDEVGKLVQAEVVKALQLKMQSWY